MLVLTLSLSFFTFVTSQVILPGHCPKVTIVQNFEASRYLGVWYEYEKYFAVFEAGGKCISAKYSLNENGTVGVVNSQFNSLTKSPSSISGYAKFNGPETEAKLSVVFPSLPVNYSDENPAYNTFETKLALHNQSNTQKIDGKVLTKKPKHKLGSLQTMKIEAPYWVLSTDYDNYSIVWSCTQLGPVNTRILWILTRQRTPANETIETAYNFLDKNNISRTFLIKTNQKDCPVS